MRRLILAFLIANGVSAVVASDAGGQTGRGRLPGDRTPREDCLPFNPALLKIDKSFGRWLLSAGSERMLMLDTERDARDALALAQRYGMHCFIGRHASTRPGQPRRLPADYRLTYWKFPTGARTTITAESCRTYDPSRLTMSNRGAVGWQVSDGSRLTLKLDNREDAESALRLAKQYSAHCVIGHDDPNPASASYAPTSRVDYWK
jgi:hypothetical protein